MEENDIIQEKQSYSTFHSDEVQEIMGRQPAWILRWGITIILLIIIGIVIACWFIKYPQTVTSAITLTSDNPPSDLAARTTGILDTVSVANGEAVTSGQLIAVIASPARYEDVVFVKGLLDSLSASGSILNPEDFHIRQELHLGNLQQDWAGYLAVWSDFKDYLELDQIEKKKKLLAGQVWRAKEYYRRLEEQRETIVEELEYEHISLARDSILFARNTISQADYETTVKSYISMKNTLAGFDATMADAHLNRLQLEQQILELETQRTKETDEYERSLIQSANVLQGEIALWMEQYVITAPYGGIVSLQNVWSRGQHVNAGDVIASIAPEGGNTVIGRLKVPSSGFGKVREGQEVNIKLNGFPYLEFGILKGIVKSISPVPENTGDGIAYTVDVTLLKGLESTYHKVFPFVQNMDGTAEIITEDMRLLERFTRPIRSLFVNR